MAEFFIKRNSTEPLLKMMLVQDGRNDLSEFYERLQSAAITFSMKDQNGVFKVYKKPCGIISRLPAAEINSEKYYIYYKWEAEDVDEVGTYTGEFDIKFYNAEGAVESNLIAPIRESLHINII